MPIFKKNSEIIQYKKYPKNRKSDKQDIIKHSVPISNKSKHKGNESTLQNSHHDGDKTPKSEDIIASPDKQANQKCKTLKAKDKNHSEHLLLNQENATTDQRLKNHIQRNSRRFVSSRRRSWIDSPIKKLNKQLIRLILELKQSNRYYKKELRNSNEAHAKDIFQLQQENETLCREQVKTSNEVEVWKRRCERLQNKNVLYTKSKALNQENEDLKEDLAVCKSVVSRLNKELSNYQDKVGSFQQSNIDPLVASTNESEDSLPCIEDKQQSWRKMYPLLLAYDEVISEKSEIIKEQQAALNSIKSKFHEMVEENQRLYEAISDQPEKRAVSIEEWQFLHSNALVVLEENDVLNEQIQLQKKKEEIMIQTNQNKIRKLKTKIASLEEGKRELQEGLYKAENHCKSLLDQQSRLTAILEKRIPLDQHEASVQECKILFEGLKVNYYAERVILVERLEAAEIEKHRLISKIKDLEANQERLSANLQTCEETLTANAIQFKQVYSAMLDASKARDVSTVAMEETMLLSQGLIEDRENTERQLKDEKILNENLQHFLERQSSLVSELQHKICEMEEAHLQEVEKFVLRIQEYERGNELLHTDQQQKLSYLENLIQEKSKRIEHLETEKQQMQADLETVWKTTTSSIQNITRI